MVFVYLHDAAAAGLYGIEYVEVVPLYSPRRPPPDFFFGCVPPEFGRWYFNDRSSPKAGLYTVNDVSFCANRLLMRGDDVMCLPQNGLHPDALRGIMEEVQGGRQFKSVEINSPVVVLVGGAYTIYGHWIVDFMPRLQILTELGYQLSAMQYLLPLDLPAFAMDWLTNLGITASQIIFTDTNSERCLIRQALVPSNLRGNGRASPLLAVAAQTFVSKINPLREESCKVRRVYISRKRWGNPLRSLVNSDEIEHICESMGYEIAHPQNLSLSAQVALFSDAKVIVGEYGSGLHGSIFSGQGTTVVALRGSLGHPGFLQSGLCEVSKQSHGYIFGKTTTNDSYQNFEVSLDDLKLCLELQAS